ncbi:TM2 domain-containing protein [Gracilibacillus alcaliphilus]|uniref:TM2 domain-containing protein n=1 Tax=Gracilibacillus alcaliphilus TaxID=1401441 RepID=UPI0019586691|nr:TM2 domain-containing protein [Gracilibacillus alcaliphilus]MBM7676744.1 TM2 domain-containing membrane protein YozV [Gracilibacillus alcaliphilus]
MERRRNILLAYILWLFLGQLGVHRFYTGYSGSAIAQALLGIIGWATTWLLVGWLFLAILGFWLIIDILLIPGLCRNPR